MIRPVFGDSTVVKHVHTNKAKKGSVTVAPTVWAGRRELRTCLSSCTQPQRHMKPGVFFPISSRLPQAEQTSRAERKEKLKTNCEEESVSATQCLNVCSVEGYLLFLSCAANAFSRHSAIIYGNQAVVLVRHYQPRK